MTANVKLDFDSLAESMRAQKLTPETAALLLKTAFEETTNAKEGLCANPRVEHCGLHRKSQSCIKWESQ